MSAAENAEALGLEPIDGIEWAGTRNDLAFGLVTQRPQLLAPEAEVRLFCVHATPLRLGMVAETPPSWGVSDPLDHFPRVAIDDRRLDDVLRLRAAEQVIARALVTSTANVLVTLLGDGILVVDDQHVWITLPPDARPSEVAAIADRMTDLSSRMTAERVGWEADFETAIAPVWSRLAAGAGLVWSADSSTIVGDWHGARVEARIDAEPCRLYTEVYAEWPSLDRGLEIERRATRGAIASAPPESSDVEALARAFDRELSGRPTGEGSDEELPAAALHAALSIATTGASLTIDDTGLVARIDSVADTDATMVPLFRGALTIAKALVAPGVPTGLYR